VGLGDRIHQCHHLRYCIIRRRKIYSADVQVHSPVFLALVLKGVVIVKDKKIRLRSANEPRVARFKSIRGDQADQNVIATRML
jgi:hypothetical protein